MIIDKIENLACYENINSDIKAIVDYLKDNDIKTLDCGSYTVNERVKFGLSENNLGKGNDPEAHRDYWDLQLCVEGEEYIDVYPITSCSQSSGYTPDIEFFAQQSEKATRVALTAGTFVILMQQDAHRPCVKTEDCEKNKKAVFKIKVN